jgi:TolA-binding protein
MRAPYTEDFYQTYNEAFRLYLEGDWPQANAGFHKILEMEPSDKPT